jgi:pyruvate/2-oxoglutarate dehydrogenase complex dihydrolipoamide dehydrogenase (E3) component
VRAEVAIVGNGVAGYACAARLAKHGIRPLLIGRGLPVDRPPLTKNALAAGKLTLLADEQRLVDLGIDRLEAMADEIDLVTRTVVAGETEVAADTIVLATGLSYRPPPIPGLDAGYVNATPGGMTRLAAALETGTRRVAVVGGGLIGVETAATLATAGHDVTIVELFDRPLARIHDPIPGLAAATLDELGVRFVGSAAITDVRVDEGLVTLCHEHGSLTADVVVAATGGRLVPPPGLSREVELPLHVGAGLRVPGLERVHAVGDLIVVPHARFGPIVFPHWDMAIGTGEHAADVIAGVAGDLDRLPYWWSDIGPRRLAEVGWAGAVEEWNDEDGMHVGRNAAGEPVAALVVDEPRRLREARGLLTA